MAFAVNPEPPEDETGPPEDPVRAANEKFVRHIAFLLESNEQLTDAFQARLIEYGQRIEALERIVAVLESLTVT
jgi:hypothetical protein